MSTAEQNQSTHDLDAILDGGPIVLFDGVCNFCDAWVRFVIRRDARRRVRFAALQSAIGQELLLRFGLPTDELNTMVFIDRGKACTRSSAALRILTQVRWPWPVLGALLVVPRFLRDPVYRLIAARRYRWFGKQECLIIPPAEQRDRFLDA